MAIIKTYMEAPSILARRLGLIGPDENVRVELELEPSKGGMGHGYLIIHITDEPGPVAEGEWDPTNTISSEDDANDPRNR